MAHLHELIPYGLVNKTHSFHQLKHKETCTNVVVKTADFCFIYHKIVDFRSIYFSQQAIKVSKTCAGHFKPVRNNQTKLRVFFFLFREQYQIFCSRVQLLVDCRADDSRVDQQRDPAVPDPHYLS